MSLFLLTQISVKRVSSSASPAHPEQRAGLQHNPKSLQRAGQRGASVPGHRSGLLPRGRSPAFGTFQLCSALVFARAKLELVEPNLPYRLN